MSKSNPFLKKIKNINKSINNLLEENLNRLKFQNIINLLRNNKIVFIFVAVGILFISYLLLPTFYKQEEISKRLNIEFEQKLNLNINFDFKNKLNYNFFPRPHFIVENPVILYDKKEISKVRKLKIFISLDNLFSIEKIIFNDLLIEDANFNLNNSNYNFFLDLLNKDFSDKELKIKNSNIFFRNTKKEVLFINKINSMKYYYDQKELKNFVTSRNKIFNYPYEVKLTNDIERKKLISTLKFNFLKLQIQNEFDYGNNLKKGLADIIYDKSKSIIAYETNLKSFQFIFSDKIENPTYKYIGKININPFYSSFEGTTKKLNLSLLFNINSFIPQILKTGILNSENIDFEINIKAQKISDYVNLKNLNLNSKIKEGLIDIDQTKFQLKSFANFTILDSLIFVKDDQLILDSKLEINVNDVNEIYKYLLTPKNLRKNINKIAFNFSHNFDQNITTLRDIRVDDKYNQKINKIMSTIILKDNKLQNKIYLKNLLNEALKYYSG